MITKEVREWLKRVECGNYTQTDIMDEFVNFSRYLTRDEIIFIKDRLKDFI